MIIDINSYRKKEAKIVTTNRNTVNQKINNQNVCSTVFFDRTENALAVKSAEKRAKERCW